MQRTGTAIRGERVMQMWSFGNDEKKVQLCDLIEISGNRLDKRRIV